MGLRVFLAVTLALVLSACGGSRVPVTESRAVTGPAPVESIEEATGSVVRRRLAAGTMLRVNELESPVLIERGDLITIHCISGGIVVKTKARARTAGRDGEMIELMMDGSRKSFRARVVGPGRAVMNLDAVDQTEERG